ncbi:MAG: FAD-binding oxidoreductase [Burkholderiaceae bacterium]|nr:FAD-binding oxidoreductase [Burkholderiaceae bacterium]
MQTPTSAPYAALIETLQTIVGSAYVLTESADGDPSVDLTAYVQDWRKRERGIALAVVRPNSTEQVAAIVKACAATPGVSIVPQGGNTGMVVGSTPDESGTQVVLSLQRMNSVRKLDVGNGTITLDAGCVLQNVQQVCFDAGYLFPLSLGSQGSCTIGGNLGTNAGGTQVVRFGNTRELCLGLEVVTAQGEVWSGLSGLRKDNTGYDLRDLFIGAEGTLGIITGATMKMYPLPASKLTAFAAVPSMDAAVTLLGLAHKYLSAGLTGFEVMGQFALSLVGKHYPQQRVPFLGMDGAPYCVVLENSDHESEAHAREQFERLLEAAMEDGCVLDAVVAENITQAKQLWHIRESIPLAQADEGLNIKHDISIPVSSIPEFVRLTDAKLETAFPGARLVNYGHLGDGNLHYNVQAPVGSDQAAFLNDQEEGVNALVFEMVDQFSGSISAEHGVGNLKVDKLPHHKSPVAIELMRTIKRALDPQNIMNPGRVVRV